MPLEFESTVVVYRTLCMKLTERSLEQLVCLARAPDELTYVPSEPHSCSCAVPTVPVCSIVTTSFSQPICQ
jgi:hypothetical protein